MLDVEDVRASYGAYKALHGVSLNVREGEVVTVLGPNGAGKTTLIKVLMGWLKAEGSVRFRGEELLDRPAWQRVSLGIGVIPEGRRLFPHLTVDDNLRMGAYLRDEAGYREGLETVFDLFPILEERRNQRAATLSGGQQQMVAIGRALMAQPQLLLMDEPSLGLQPSLVDLVFDTVAKLEDLGVTTFLVEQNAAQALRVADRGYVMELGRVVLQGTAEDLREEPKVREAYLGG